MTTAGLLATPHRAVPVANDVGLRSPYRATSYRLAPGASLAMQQNGEAETIVFVEDGVIELSINGGEGYLSQGEFVRIAPGAFYACRNIGKRSARLLSVPVVRTESTRATTVVVEIAAA